MESRYQLWDWENVLHPVWHTELGLLGHPFCPVYNFGGHHFREDQIFSLKIR